MTEAQKESNRKWREANADKVRKYCREYMRIYRKKYPERRRAAVRKYYYANQEDIQALYRQKYKDNLPDSRDYSRKQHFSYIRSIKGHLVQKWQSLQARLKGQVANYLNSTGLDILQKDKFLKIVMANKRFKHLWREYERSHFDINCAPSFYRIDTSEGYIKRNLVVLAKGDYNKEAVMREVKRGRII